MTPTNQSNALESISYDLQNAPSESARMWAFGKLLDYREKHPNTPEAEHLFNKYQVLSRDFTLEVKSGKKVSA